MTKTINLSWSRFCFCFAAIGIFPVLLIISGINDKDSWSATAAVCLFFISLMGFFSLGWGRLRRANAIQPISMAETDRILQLLIGPIFPAVAWFVGTIFAIIAFVVASTLYGYAA